jgi:hypothetical protein
LRFLYQNRSSALLPVQTVAGSACAGTVLQELDLSPRCPQPDTAGLTARSVAMVETSKGPLLQLQGGELLALHGVQLSVEQGIVWVTCAGDLDDHFLGAGDVMLLEHGADALVGVDAPARLRIAPHRTGLRSRLGAWQRHRPAARAQPPIAWDIDERSRPWEQRRAFTPSR